MAVHSWSGIDDIVIFGDIFLIKYNIRLPDAENLYFMQVPEFVVMNTRTIKETVDYEPTVSCFACIYTGLQTLNPIRSLASRVQVTITMDLRGLYFVCNSVKIYALHPSSSPIGP
jgi:hypothetical protein